MASGRAEAARRVGTGRTGGVGTRAEAARRVDRWLMDEDSLFTEKNNST